MLIKYISKFIERKGNNIMNLNDLNQFVCFIVNLLMVIYYIKKKFKKLKKELNMNPVFPLLINFIIKPRITFL